MKKTSHSRFWELDVVRGIAIIMMVFYHFVFDLNFLGVIQLAVTDGWWRIFARVTAILFLTLVGISLSISCDRSLAIARFSQFIKFLKRGLKIFLLAIAITIATYFYLNNDGTIWFGILHLIAVSIVLAYPLLHLKNTNLILAILIISIGYIAAKVHPDTSWLLPFGLYPKNFYSLDYFPIFPWFGIILFGIFLGKTYYPAAKPHLKIPTQPNSISLKILQLLGQHSLAIYLIHQPIIIALIKIY